MSKCGPRFVQTLGARFGPMLGTKFSFGFSARFVPRFGQKLGPSKPSSWQSFQELNHKPEDRVCQKKKGTRGFKNEMYV